MTHIFRHSLAPQTSAGDVDSPKTFQIVAQNDSRRSNEYAPTLAAQYEPQWLLEYFASFAERLNRFGEIDCIPGSNGRHQQMKTTSTLRRKSARSLHGQSLALIGPLERLGHSPIVILDKGEDPGL